MGAGHYSPGNSVLNTLPNTVLKFYRWLGSKGEPFPCLQAQRVCSAKGGQQRALDPVELELKMAVSHLIGIRTTVSRQSS